MTTIADVLAPMRFPNGVTAKNALWLAPLTNLQSDPDGTLSAAEERWLLRRAEGGFGVVETCAAFVSQDGKAWPGQLGIDRDAFLPRLRELADGLSARGALGIVQLFHGGARSPEAVSGSEPWSATAIAEAASGLERARAASEDDILRTIDAFRDAAVRAHQAGFSGVEVHGAHGYVLCQFLSATLNTRDDSWGGAPLENRARFLREVVRAIRKAVPDTFLVGVRLSPEKLRGPHRSRPRRVGSGRRVARGGRRRLRARLALGPPPARAQVPRREPLRAPAARCARAYPDRRRRPVLDPRRGRALVFVGAHADCGGPDRPWPLGDHQPGLATTRRRARVGAAPTAGHRGRARSGRREPAVCPLPAPLEGLRARRALTLTRRPRSRVGGRPGERPHRFSRGSRSRAG